MTLNPERGFTQWVELLSDAPLDAVRAGGSSLGFALVSLAAYRDKPLDAAFLGLLDRAFHRAREAGLKLVLRFAYAMHAGEPDAPLARIHAHLDALAPHLHANDDVIFVVQAGFIGAWGEWHSSTNGLTSPQAMRAVANAVLAAVPQRRFVQVRTPAIKQAISGAAPLHGDAAFGGSPAARLGFHNDCVLTASGDSGTFRNEDDQRFMAADARFVPVGGETCRPDSRNTGDGVLRELARFRFTFLNGGYHEAVLADWRRRGIYEVLAERLGYLLTVTGARSTHTAAGLQLEFVLENRGLAAPVYSRPLHVVVAREADATAVSHAVPLDLRQLGPGESRAFSVTVADPVGACEVGLALPDPAERLATREEFAVRLAVAQGSLPSRFQRGINWLVKL